MGARQAALTALEKFRRNDAWSDTALDAAIGKLQLDRRDAALASHICFGVLQNMALLDFYIDEFSSIKTKRLEPKVLDILRISAYQIIFLDRIPPSAAVNEGVRLCKKHSPRAQGLVNAVLRRISENNNKLPEPNSNNTPEYLALKFSHPLWIVNELIDALGEIDAAAELQRNNAPAPICAQVNTLKTTAASLNHSAHTSLADCVILDGAGEISALPEFKSGEIYIQDAAAKLAVLSANPQKGQCVLDLCAAPGGKSFAAAILMQNEGKILSCDIHNNKLKRVELGASRLGISIIETRCMDARIPDKELIGVFNVVIADVPCSGLGVIRKKPEIRYKSETEISGLPPIQLQILLGAAKCVKPGGTVVYSTCTWRKQENEYVIADFLSKNPDFELIEMQTLWTYRDETDGFFICCLKKPT